ncbi:MAG: N-acetylmuramoyl-L-alanine amidase [Magnetococcus sp. DMHC-1]
MTTRLSHSPSFATAEKNFTGNHPVKVIVSALLFSLVAFYGYADEPTRKQPLRIAVDIGHTASSPGAISSRGRGEFLFNQELGEVIKKYLITNGYKKSFTIVNPGSLQDRVRIARQRRADLLLSIHHDSVQQYYLHKWTHDGIIERYCDRFRGYSLLVSTKNKYYSKSLKLATLIGLNLIKNGFDPTLHHAEKISGENHELINAELGIYKYDDIVVLKTASMPAVILEAGIIIHREEEMFMRKTETMERISQAVVESINTYAGDPLRLK